MGAEITRHIRSGLRRCCLPPVSYYSVGSSQSCLPPMRPRDLLTLCGILALGATFGIVTLGTDTHADELPPSTLPTSTATGPTTPTAPDAAHAVGEVGKGAPVEAAMVKDSPERIDTSGWTTGTVRGDVQIAVSVLERITTISICVEEMRNAIDPVSGSFRHPNKYIVPVKMGIGTPTFEVTGIAFSEYPYSVFLYAPGLDGGRKTVVIDKKTPLHNDLVLPIMPGSPFSVLLRDQDQNPYPNIDVRLIAVGDRSGRQDHMKVTDNFGSAVFDSVLSGDYQVVTGQKGMPLAEPDMVTVQQASRMYGPKVRGQGYVVTVPRGMPLQFSVGYRGYGIADAKIKMQASDKIKLTVLEAVTDFSGRADFPHLTPGIWQIDVTKDNYQITTKQITIKDGELPPIAQIELRPIR